MFNKIYANRDRYLTLNHRVGILHMLSPKHSRKYGEVYETLRAAGLHLPLFGVMYTLLADPECEWIIPEWWTIVRADPRWDRGVNRNWTPLPQDVSFVQRWPWAPVNVARVDEWEGTVEHLAYDVLATGVIVWTPYTDGHEFRPAWVMGASCTRVTAVPLKMRDLAGHPPPYPPRLFDKGVMLTTMEEAQPIRGANMPAGAQVLSPVLESFALKSPTMLGIVGVNVPPFDHGCTVQIWGNPTVRGSAKIMEGTPSLLDLVPLSMNGQVWVELHPETLGLAALGDRVLVYELVSPEAVNHRGLNIYGGYLADRIESLEADHDVRFRLVPDGSLCGVAGEYRFYRLERVRTGNFISDLKDTFWMSHAYYDFKNVNIREEPRVLPKPEDFPSRAAWGKVMWSLLIGELGEELVPTARKLMAEEAAGDFPGDPVELVRRIADARRATQALIGGRPTYSLA